ncbi:Gfo/Idh/MocA family protein [Brachybacterium muris]|uniref:Gfo/Idh/MocA family protein n=1 Tax=Brachybacterium muris TaxID=219301 RepID=UPI00223BB03E|nr:Gfo/Idh/MocA family oxidoreductase [Brachybacterium muris]MCT1655571.1 Gfo/Idh/MocA family oxidoreductase [Brachybacterium muris]
MTAPLRIAALSAWHVHAEEYAREAQQHPGTELVAVWDEEPERGRALAESLGVEFAPDLEALLARQDLDGVTVTTATNVHREVIGKAIAAGKHVFTEKLLAPTVAEGEELITAAREAGVRLTVSLPRLAHGYALALRRVLEEGRLGRLTYSRVRLAHNGSTADWLPARFYDPVAAIGGAFSDLAAHPVYLTQLILGTDVQVSSATYTDMTGRGVEDNAVVTVTGADGAIGVIETGFVTPTSPFSIEVQGTEGSFQHGLGEGGGTSVDTGEGPVALDVPADAENPFAQWVEAIRTGEDTTENLERAQALTALVVAANAAA